MIKKSATLLLFTLFAFLGKAQDEIIKLGDSVATDYELKIQKITKDTLYFKAFRKSEYFLMSKIIAYRYKDKAWEWVNAADKEKYVFRNGQLLLKHLQPDIILKPYALDLSQEKRIKSLKHHKVLFTIDGKKRTMTSDGEICFGLAADTTNSFFVLRLKKISGDSLFLFSRLEDKKKIYGMPINAFSKIAFNTDFQKALKIMTGPETSMRIRDKNLLQHLVAVPKKYDTKGDSYEVIPVGN